MPRLWVPRDGPLAKSGKVKTKVKKSNKKAKNRRLQMKQNFTGDTGDAVVLNPYFTEPTAEEVARAAREQGVTPDQLARMTGKGEGWLLAQEQGDPEGRMELSASEDTRPTTEMVEARAREEGVDFGTALRREIEDREIKQTAFAQPEPRTLDRSPEEEEELRRYVESMEG